MISNDTAQMAIPPLPLEQLEMYTTVYVARQVLYNKMREKEILWIFGGRPVKQNIILYSKNKRKTPNVCN
jgi:hypothetical protein